MRASMEAGADPANPQVHQLTHLGKALVEEFTGGDPSIAASLRHQCDSEPAVRKRPRINMALVERVGRS